MVRLTRVRVTRELKITDILVYMSMPLQILAARQDAKWDGYTMPHHRSLTGKTVGLLVSVFPLHNPPDPLGVDSVRSPLDLLSVCGRSFGIQGYGHIARETARLFQAFNCQVIAANSSGKRRTDIGVSHSPPLLTSIAVTGYQADNTCGIFTYRPQYVVPGTGDVAGSIASEIYSTSDAASFNEFLSRSEILVASLPSTPKTQWLLTKEKLCESLAVCCRTARTSTYLKYVARLPVDAVFVNVGRGDLVKSSELQPISKPSFPPLCFVHACPDECEAPFAPVSIMRMSGFSTGQDEPLTPSIRRPSRGPRPRRRPLWRRP